MKINEIITESTQQINEIDDDYEDCDACSGTGEGRWEGETCHACHGSGVQEPEHDDDDFDIPDDDFDFGDDESYYEKSLRSRGLGEDIKMKHQRDHKTQQFPDTSNSLAKRTYPQAEVPNVTKSADGHPTVKYRADSTKKTVNSRVEPTITSTKVKRKDSDRPIPTFLKMDEDTPVPQSDYGMPGFGDREQPVQETIVKKGGKWEVQSKSGKNLGQSDTKAGAVKRLGQVEWFKKHK
jgi:hypothetical protein